MHIINRLATNKNYYLKINNIIIIAVFVLAHSTKGI